MDALLLDPDTGLDGQGLAEDMGCARLLPKWILRICIANFCLTLFSVLTGPVYRHTLFLMPSLQSEYNVAWWHLGSKLP